MNKGSYFLLSNVDFPATPAHAPSFNLQSQAISKGLIYLDNDRFGAHLACPVGSAGKRSRSVISWLFHPNESSIYK